MRVPTPTTPVAFAPPDLGLAETAEVRATLESGWLLTGPRVKQFERDFAAYTGAPHALPLSSRTAALHLSLLAAEASNGDEVITTGLQHFRALHLHSFYRERFGFERGMFPGAEAVSDQTPVVAARVGAQRRGDRSRHRGRS